MSDWRRTYTEKSPRWTCPDGEELLTKIDDDHGARNEAKLTRFGNLWHTGPTQSSMYVYYTPTHWKPIND
jgi:hypothetical protein